MTRRGCGRKASVPRRGAGHALPAAGIRSEGPGMDGQERSALPASFGNVGASSANSAACSRGATSRGGEGGAVPGAGAVPTSGAGP